MSNFGASAGWGLVVGGSLVAGALAAAVLTLSSRAAALLAAFGGGVLLAAIALELVPEAEEMAGAGVTAAGIVTGTIIYVAGDAWLTRDDTMRTMRRSGHAAAAGKSMRTMSHAEAARGEAIAAGLFIDGVPESMALGLTVAEGSIGLALLAGILIGNVVEAYGATQPIIAGGHPRRFAVGLMTSIGLSLVVATILGGTLLTGVEPAIIGAAEAIAAGAVLAVVSVSVIPHAFSEVSSAVAVASVLGFVAGFLLS